MDMDARSKGKQSITCTPDVGMKTSKSRGKKRASASRNQEAEKKAELKRCVFNCVLKVDKVVL